jgi:hypothetical protein
MPLLPRCAKVARAVADMEIEEIKNTCRLFAKYARVPGAGPIGRLDMGSRFRWLTATRSTVLQCSRVHPGLTEDPAATLKDLHAHLVTAE